MRSISFYNKQSLKAIRNAKKKGIINTETFDKMLDDICGVDNKEEAINIHKKVLNYIDGAVMYNI